MTKSKTEQHVVPDEGCLEVYAGDLSVNDMDTRTGTAVYPEFRSQGDSMYFWKQGPSSCVPLNDGVNQRYTGSALTLSSLNLRSSASATAKVLVVVKPNERVALRGPKTGYWYPVVYGSFVGYMHGYYLGSIRYDTDFTHRFRWWLEKNESGTYQETRTLLNSIWTDPRGWQRAGLLIEPARSAAEAQGIVRVTNATTCSDPTNSCVRLASGKALIQISLKNYGSLRWLRVVSHEMGHAAFAAKDTYTGSTSGIDPNLTSSIMGNMYEGNLVYCFPDQDDINSARLWLKGKAINMPVK